MTKENEYKASAIQSKDNSHPSEKAETAEIEAAARASFLRFERYWRTLPPNIGTEIPLRDASGKVWEVSIKYDEEGQLSRIQLINIKPTISQKTGNINGEEETVHSLYRTGRYNPDSSEFATWNFIRKLNHSNTKWSIESFINLTDQLLSPFEKQRPKAQSHDSEYFLG
jgi:hypothetical protein